MRKAAECCFQSHPSPRSQPWQRWQSCCHFVCHTHHPHSRRQSPHPATHTLQEMPPSLWKGTGVCTCGRELPCFFTSRHHGATARKVPWPRTGGTSEQTDERNLALRPSQQPLCTPRVQMARDLETWEKAPLHARSLAPELVTSTLGLACDGCAWGVHCPLWPGP